MAERWWHYIGLHLKKAPAPLLLCCMPVPFSWSPRPKLMYCRLSSAGAGGLICTVDYRRWEQKRHPSLYPSHTVSQPCSWDDKLRLCHKMLDVWSYLLLLPTGESEGCVPFSQSQLDSEDVGVLQSSIWEWSFTDVPGLSLEWSLSWLGCIGSGASGMGAQGRWKWQLQEGRMPQGAWSAITLFFFCQIFPAAATLPFSF